MKTKTRKLIAAITATALLGSTLGISAYALSKNENSEFGFNGTYNLTALAEEKASASTITVLGNNIDTTSTLTLTSTNNDYTLFVTVVDTDDMSALEDINVGYTIGENTYNAQASGLSNVIYNSLSIKTGEDTYSDPITAAELATSFSNITSAKLVIAEVASSNVNENAGELTIAAKGTIATQNFTKDDKESTFFTISGTTSSDKGTVTYNGLTLTKCLKMESSTSIKFTLEEAATLTLVFGGTTSAANSTVKINSASYDLDGDGIYTGILEAGSYTITKGGSINLFYIDIYGSETKVMHTFAEIPSSVSSWNWTKQEDGTYTCKADAVFDCTNNGCTGTITKTIDAMVTSESSLNESGEEGTLYTAKIDGTELSTTKFIVNGVTKTYTYEFGTLITESTSNGADYCTKDNASGILAGDEFFTIVSASHTVKITTKTIGEYTGAIYVNNSSGELKLKVAKAGKLIIYYGANDSGASSFKDDTITVSGGTDVTVDKNVGATSTPTIGYCEITLDSAGQEITLGTAGSNRLAIYALVLEYVETGSN